MVCIALALLEPLLDVPDQALELVDCRDSEHFFFTSVKGCSHTLHSDHLLLCGLKCVCYFNFLGIAARPVLSRDIKSAIFVDRESTFDFILSSFPRCQRQIESTSLLVICYKLVRALVYIDA